MKITNRHKMIFIFFVLSIISAALINMANPMLVTLGKNNQLYFTGISELNLLHNGLREKEENQLLHFKNLKVLNIRLSEIENLDFLNAMDLKELQFGYPMLYEHQTDNLDYSLLYTQCDLEILKIIGMCCHDLSFLSAMHNLQELELSFSILNEKQLSNIGNVDSLHTLNLNNSKIPSLAKISHLNNLHTLKINHSSIEDMNSLFNMHIEVLEMRDVNIGDVVRLIEIDTLQKVYISNNQFSEDDINVLIKHGIQVISE